MTPGIRAIEASKITLATFGAIMGAFGVSVWLLERSRGLARGTGRPPYGGGHRLTQEKPSEPSPGRGRGGFLRILRIRGLGLEDSDLQVVPPTLYTLRGQEPPRN